MPVALPPRETLRCMKTQSPRRRHSPPRKDSKISCDDRPWPWATDALPDLAPNAATHQDPSHAQVLLPVTPPPGAKLGAIWTRSLQANETSVGGCHRLRAPPLQVCPIPFVTASCDRAETSEVSCGELQICRDAGVARALRAPRLLELS